MRIELLHRNPSNSRLILIFAGWSTAAPLYSHIERRGWDTAVVTDYTDLNFDSELIARYDTIYVYAWSMGVWAASQVLSPDLVTMAFAINGTEYPADDQKGIPADIFKSTADRLDERNLLKFRRRIVGTSDAELIGRISEGARNADALKTELYAILSQSQRPDSDRRLRWRRAYIGKADRIFPPANQESAWSGTDTEIFRLDAPHYIDLKNIVDSTIPDMDKVGRRFAESLDTYDSSAGAQANLAVRLAAVIESMHRPAGQRLLEIGQGSGMLTRRYAAVVQPASIDYIDLYPTAHLGLAPEENYYVGDAELLIDTLPGRYDMIVSGSTIQWFRNLRRFLRIAATKLNADGCLVCSTFLPGTLDVLDEFRPSPMLYLPAEEIRQLASQFFGDVHTEEETITLTFATPKEALLHLRQTGVGGAFGRFGSLRQLIESLERQGRPVKLRFQALYLVAGSPKSVGN